VTVDVSHLFLLNDHDDDEIYDRVNVIVMNDDLFFLEIKIDNNEYK
jgi:hypothetical protein